MRFFLVTHFLFLHNKLLFLKQMKIYTFDRVIRIIIGIVVATVSLWLLNRLSGVLIPFFVGWLIAYLLYPIVKFFQYKCRLKYRILSIFVTLLVVVSFLVLCAFILIPSITSEFSRAGSLLVEYIPEIKKSDFSGSFFYQWIINNLENIDFQHILTWENLNHLIEKFTPKFFSLISNTWQFLGGFLVAGITLLYVIFILIDYEKIATGFINIIPNKYKCFVKTLIDDVEKGMNKYFRGQSTIALLVGILFSIGFSVIQLPLAITMGLFIGVLNLVPYLQVIGIIPVVFLGLLKAMETQQNFWWILLSIFVVFIVVQCIQDLFLVPKIMGKAMGLNPAIILLSLSVWGSLFGIIGMIIALPTTTLVISYYKRFILNNPSLDNNEKAT